MADPRATTRVKWTCGLGCGESEYDDLEAVVDHLRLLHPDVYGDGPERWSDGTLVVHDETLEPEEFR